MRLFQIMVLGALLCPFLVACESTSNTNSGLSTNLEKPTEKDIDIIVQDDPGVIPETRLSSAPGVRSVPSFPKPNDRDLVVISDKLAGGAVEIYDFDAPAPRGPVLPSRRGIPSAVDSNVTIFPLDGDIYPGQAGLRENSWPNSVLPKNNIGQTLLTSRSPLSYGDGAKEPFEELSSKIGQGYNPSQIYFAHGSSNLDQADRGVLVDVAQQAKFSPVSRVRVEGHASSRVQTSDPVKSKVLNLKESMNRAFEVSRNLIQKGVPAEKIQTIGWGDTIPPAVSSGSPESVARRVDIYTGATQ